MNSGSFMKKIIGLILFFVAIGMLLMMVIHNRLIGLIILALLDICRSFFAYAQDKTSFEIKEYIHSLSVDELMKWSTGGYFPNTLMTIYQTGKIDLEELRNTEDVIVAEPLGELDLLWILSKLPKEYLGMQRLQFTTSDESFDFDMRDGEDSIRIQMTNYMVEVER